jgi:hypothetical protein
MEETKEVLERWLKLQQIFDDYQPIVAKAVRGSMTSLRQMRSALKVMRSDIPALARLTLTVEKKLRAMSRERRIQERTQ